jgi:ubiquinone/menaquinone biosynthesis C-methylase UbiE
MEVGSGTGYIMEGVNSYLVVRGRAASVIEGIDIAEHMLAKARRGLGNNPPYAYTNYDGVTIPRPAGVYNLIYSVAALQNVPKAYVYNLFFEMKRPLKPGGYVVINLLSWKQFAHQKTLIPWWTKITSQVELREAHWHHFYSKEELEAVLKIGTGFGFVEVRDEDGVWVCAGEHARRVTGRL